MDTYIRRPLRKALLDSNQEAREDNCGDLRTEHPGCRPWRLLRLLCCRREFPLPRPRQGAVFGGSTFGENILIFYKQKMGLFFKPLEIGENQKFSYTHFSSSLYPSPNSLNSKNTQQECDETKREIVKFYGTLHNLWKVINSYSLSTIYYLR